MSHKYHTLFAGGIFGIVLMFFINFKNWVHSLNLKIIFNYLFS